MLAGLLASCGSESRQESTRYRRGGDISCATSDCAHATEMLLAGKGGPAGPGSSARARGQPVPVRQQELVQVPLPVELGPAEVDHLADRGQSRHAQAPNSLAASSSLDSLV